MPRGLVLVIEDDEWVARLLKSAIGEAGYQCVVCSTARVGLETAIKSSPDCIICDIDLPDSDGYSVARDVRTHPSRISVTPFLFLSGLDDEKSRLEGFHVGADVYMTKPFRVDEVVAQIDALVHMAARLRARRDSMLSLPPSAQSSAIEGDLGQMSIATVLTVLEMERRSGVFEVQSKKRRAHLEISRGGVVSGVVGGTKVSALTALRTMLSWNVGRFSFSPGAAPTGPAPSGLKSLGAFLIEAMRLEDEAARVDLELPPSRRPSAAPSRLAPPSLGGPPSSRADFAPPSSRAPDWNRQAEMSLALEPELIDWEPADDAVLSEPRAVSTPRVMTQAIPPPAPAVRKAPPPLPAAARKPPPLPTNIKKRT